MIKNTWIMGNRIMGIHSNLVSIIIESQLLPIPFQFSVQPDSHNRTQSIASCVHRHKSSCTGTCAERVCRYGRGWVRKQDDCGTNQPTPYLGSTSVPGSGKQNTIGKDHPNNKWKRHKEKWYLVRVIILKNVNWIYVLAHFSFSLCSLIRIADITSAQKHL